MISKSWKSIHKAIGDNAKISLRKGNDPALNALLEQYKLFSNIPTNDGGVFTLMNENINQCGEYLQEYNSYK